MPSKQLSASIRFNTQNATRSLDKLLTKINAINKAIGKPNNTNGLEKQVNKTLMQEEKLKQAVAKRQLAEQRVTTEKHKGAIQAEKLRAAEIQTATAAAKHEDVVNRINAKKQKTVDNTNKVVQKTNEWSSKLGTVRSMLKSNNSILGSMWNKLKGIAATYLGVMGAKAVIGASDTITSAENRLNNLPGGNPQLTAESLDKIYGAAQRSRSGYSDMIGNVSKSMTLAGDAFQGNIDNAIRFQEIMSKAYTIGGASAAEQASSMYQLVQALGSGVLQGDELRSVREGAPIAYKKIEEFAQGVFDTEKSLKDLASQGVITSDIIVAAIMDAESEITKSFENTKITFAQTWDNIKNMALKAFTPVLQKLNDLLNEEESQAAIQRIGDALVWLADKAIVALDYLIQGINWVADNWDWLKNVVIAAIILMITWHIAKSAVVISCTLAEAAIWIVANWQMVLAVFGVVTAITILLMGILGVISVFAMWKAGAIDTCQAIVRALLIIGVVFLVLGTICTGGILAIYGLAILAIAGILHWLEQICGAITWFGGLCKNIGLVICNVATNIGIAFSNAWHGALESFWNFIAGCLEGLNWLAKPLGAIAELFGKSFDYGSFVQGIRNKASAHASKKQSYVPTTAFAEGWGKDSYAIGANWASGLKGKLNALGSKNQTWQGLGGIGSTLDGVSNSANGLLNPYDPAYSVGGAYDPSGALGDINSGLDKLNGGVSDVGGSAGKIADSMEVTEEDLKYLRQIAEMEWKKEYTTASIKIDMSNYNTVNGDSDLDGIVTKLSDKLREELAVVANGVYA